jgi:arylsulfatase A-like enzyme
MSHQSDSGIPCHREVCSIAHALEPLGYATGQFGKNHLGDLGVAENTIGARRLTQVSRPR